MEDGGGLRRDVGKPRGRAEQRFCQGNRLPTFNKGGSTRRAAVEKGLQRELQSRVPGEDSEGGSGRGCWER